MKYGETLQQRSIPLWESYNVDYNDIKHLIKVRTTHGQGQARTIPGSDNEAKAFQAFEDELYNELKEQHQRIDLFVQSKAGEIARRLAHLDKQIAQLGIRSFSKGQTRLPVRRLEKFSRAEEATLKAGEDIQSLSRFVGAQRTAFQKLLKKYKKWTKSSALGVRFRTEVLDRPTSFSNRDFEPLLAQWTEVLAAVRAPFIDQGNWHYGLRNPIEGSQPDPSVRRQPLKSLTKQVHQESAGNTNSVSELHSAWEDGSNIDIDTALAVLPLGRGATRAVYWVHPDNIVQVHILLLQHTRLHRSNWIVSPESPSSSKSSPRASFSNSSAKPASRTDDEVGVLVCDDLQRFSKIRSSETISITEDCPGTVAEKAAASIRFSPSGEAVVVVDTESGRLGYSANWNEKRLPKIARFKRKNVRQLFEASSIDRFAKDDGDGDDPKRVFEWLTQHREVQPLVQLLSRRTRFVGLRNSNDGGVWATLDKDISMKVCFTESLASGKGLTTISEGGTIDSEAFPHAILEVRVEGDTDSKLVEILNSSHLVERVRGFSLETHAVATLCKPSGMPRPFWLPVLGQDIRKIPAAPKMPNRRSSQGGASPEAAGNQRSSVSAPSTQNEHSSSGFSALRGESSATSAPEVVLSPAPDPPNKKRRKSQRKLMLQKRSSQPSQAQRQRYWNEFDDGSEGSENEAYTIYIDPNASYSFPGTATVSKFFTSLVSHIKASEAKASSWFKHPPPNVLDEHQPLYNSFPSPSIDDSEVSDTDTSPIQSSRNAKRHYSTFPSRPQSAAARARETFLFRSCLASFTASIILLFVAAILETTGRKKAEITVDAGVVVGVAASLVFAIVAVGCMIGRKDDVGWVQRAIVFLFFACVVLGSGLLLAALSSV